MEQANDKPKRRRVPNKGSWKPGQSGNPGGGRPRSGLALATTIRERIDPNEVLDLVTRYLADESVPLQDRLDTLLPWLHAGYLKPPQTSALHVTGDADQLAARSFEHLSDDELRERLEWIKGVRRELTDGESDQDPPTSD